MCLNIIDEVFCKFGKKMKNSFLLYSLYLFFIIILLLKYEYIQES